MNELINEIERMVNIKIAQNDDMKSKNKIAQVIETNGFTVDLNLLQIDNSVMDGDIPLKNIPILQQRNIQPCIKKGDIGILLNIGIDLNNLIYEKEYDITFYNEYYLFLPFMQLKEFASNAEDFLIQSNIQNSNVTLNDTSITMQVKESKDSENLSKLMLNKDNVEMSASKNITSTAKEAINFTSEKTMTTTCQNKYTIDCKDEVSIKGAKPIEIGCNAGTLKACFDAVFQAMDAIASGMTGQTTNPASYQSAKTALQQQINQIVK